MIELHGHIRHIQLQGKINAVPGIVGAGGGGGAAATIQPLTVTKNGTYGPQHSTATVTWGLDMEPDFTLTVDGITLRVKKAEDLVVPESIDLLALPEYGLTVTGPDGTQQTIPMTELGLLDLDGAGSAYMTEELMYAVVWCRDAAVLNELAGAAVFEDNTVYLTDFLFLMMGEEAAGATFTLTAAGKMADGYMPITVEVSGGPIDLSKIPEVESLEVTDTSPTAVRYGGELYLLCEGEMKNG